jgi:tRNA pseudouridine55 synthase
VLKTRADCSLKDDGERTGGSSSESQRTVMQSFSKISTAPASGILIIDKPEGLTSFAVVSKINRLLPEKKVGHCGTLDPIATGVLLICLDQATRISGQLSEQDKAYRFTIQMGVETDTLDRTGCVTRVYDGEACQEEELRSVLNGFMGRQVQEAPRFAAVRIQGRHLYEWSRKGIEMTAPKREISIHRIELLAYDWPRATLEVHCSKGTYVRQLAADIGKAMECGAHVSELRRLSSGPFRIEDAISVDALKDTIEEGCWREKLVPMSKALSHLPAVVIEDEGVLKRLRAGNLGPDWEAENRKPFGGHSKAVRIVNAEDRLEALWWPNPDAEQRRRLRVFHY